MSSNPEWERDDPRLDPGFSVEERRAVSSGFGAYFNACKHGQAARDARRKVLDDQEYAIRRLPWTNAAIIPRRGPRTLHLNVDAWAHGEILRYNDVWFRVEGVGGWIWSGEFRPEDRGVSGIQEMQVLQSEETGHTSNEDLPLSKRGATPANTFSKNLREFQSESSFSVARPQSFNQFGDLLSNSLGSPAPNPRKAVRTLQHSAEEERNIQGAMAYRIGPHPWFVGYRLIVDRHDGRTQIFWRLTEASATRTGHKMLERYVLRRQRLWEAANPKLVTARDRWIVQPTQAEETAKETTEWDAQFREAQEGK